MLGRSSVGDDRCPAVVFVQRGRSFYFPVVLSQAARRCINTPIFVIADVDPRPSIPRVLQSKVTWVAMKDVDASAAEFRKVYVHLSVNRPWLERFCFERWFMIRDLCADLGVSSVIHLDSDVLVTSDIGVELPRRGPERVMFSRSMGPHVAFFRSFHDIDSFCGRIMEAYGTAGGVAGLRQEYQAICDRGQFGSISDMRFFGALATEMGEEYGDTFEVVNAAACDHCVGMKEGYEWRLGAKVVRHRGGAAYCKKLEGGELVRMLLLHFQGISKIRMAVHADVKSLGDAVRAAKLLAVGAWSYAARAHRLVYRRVVAVLRKRQANRSHA